MAKGSKSGWLFFTVVVVVALVSIWSISDLSTVGEATKSKLTKAPAKSTSYSKLTTQSKVAAKPAPKTTTTSSKPVAARPGPSTAQYGQNLYECRCVNVNQAAEACADNAEAAMTACRGYCNSVHKQPAESVRLIQRAGC